MKDKLYKNNHRGIYYRVRAFFFAFVLFASASAIAVIPTYIIVNGANNEATLAEQKEENNDEEKDLEENGEDDVDSSYAY